MASFSFFVIQLQRIGSQLQQAFTVSNMGGSLLFQSRHYGFQLMWDTQESIKIRVSHLTHIKMIQFRGILVHNIVEHYFDTYQFLTQNTVVSFYHQSCFYLVAQFNYTKIPDKLLIFLASTNFARV
jgi:hypothetical protein